MPRRFLTWATDRCKSHSLEMCPGSFPPKVHIQAVAKTVTARFVAGASLTTQGQVVAKHHCHPQRPNVQNKVWPCLQRGGLAEMLRKGPPSLPVPVTGPPWGWVRGIKRRVRSVKQSHHPAFIMSFLIGPGSLPLRFKVELPGTRTIWLCSPEAHSTVTHSLLNALFLPPSHPTFRTPTPHCPSPLSTGQTPSMYHTRLKHASSLKPLPIAPAYSHSPASGCWTTASRPHTALDPHHSFSWGQMACAAPNAKIITALLLSPKGPRTVFPVPGANPFQLLMDWWVYKIVKPWTFLNV